MSHDTILDCGCVIRVGGGRVWCPTHGADTPVSRPLPPVNQFVKCDFCFHVGDRLLCSGCLKNRNTIAALTAEVLRLMQTRIVYVLNFTGFADDTHAVARVFMAHGCPQDIAYRIVEQLRTARERRATVMDTVDLKKLADDLAPFKIAVENLGVQTQTWGD